MTNPAPCRDPFLEDENLDPPIPTPERLHHTDQGERRNVYLGGTQGMITSWPYPGSKHRCLLNGEVRALQR